VAHDPNGHLVEREFLTRSLWDQFDAPTASEVARSVERCLPVGWEFFSVAPFAAGNQQRYVALFEYDERVFSLVPGGEATLGYDPAQPTSVPQELVREWLDNVRGLEGWEDATWEGYLSTVLSPLRTVHLGPYLIASHPRHKKCATGAAERVELRRKGLSLPTADQWEYACSGGTRSLWYFGDSFDGSPRNAFGLLIAYNTYILEALDTPGVYCGGDGGVRACSGACDLEYHVPLSSWHRCVQSPEIEDTWHSTVYRPVFQIPDAALG
jgi:hypothetical protein